VPFQEIIVNTEEAVAKLKKASGADEVPVLTVGKDVQRGFEAGSFNASLDAAGYPSASVRKPAATNPQPAKRTADAEENGAKPGGPWKLHRAPTDKGQFLSGRQSIRQIGRFVLGVNDNRDGRCVHLPRFPPGARFLLRCATIVGESHLILTPPFRKRAKHVPFLSTRGDR